jgi:hypothetical protein
MEIMKPRKLNCSAIYNVFMNLDLEAEKRKKRSCLDLDNGSVYTGGKHK